MDDKINKAKQKIKNGEDDNDESSSDGTYQGDGIPTV